MAKRGTKLRRSGEADFARICRLTAGLLGVEHSTSYGTPALKVRGKLFARLHQDGEALVVNMGQQERRMRMEADPSVYFITDHYLNYPWILVRLDRVEDDDLRDLLREAWVRVAPSKLVLEAAQDNQADGD
jgi:hypothetical protein